MPRRMFVRDRDHERSGGRASASARLSVFQDEHLARMNAQVFRGFEVNLGVRLSMRHAFGGQLQWEAM